MKVRLVNNAGNALIREVDSSELPFLAVGMGYRFKDVTSGRFRMGVVSSIVIHPEPEYNYVLVRLSVTANEANEGSEGHEVD